MNNPQPTPSPMEDSRERSRRILGDLRIFQSIYNDLRPNFRHEIVRGRWVYVYDGPDPYELEDNAFPGTVAAIKALKRVSDIRTRIDEVEGWMQIVSVYPNTSNVLEPLHTKLHRRHDELLAELQQLESEE